MIHEELSREIIGAAMEMRTIHNLAKSLRPFTVLCHVERSRDISCLSLLIRAIRVIRG
jgi:hypothetical protein